MNAVLQAYVEEEIDEDSTSFSKQKGPRTFVLLDYLGGEGEEESEVPTGRNSPEFLRACKLMYSRAPINVS